MRNEYHFDFNKEKWKRAQQHLRKYGRGQLLPKPVLPFAKQVCNNDNTMIISNLKYNSQFHKL